MILLIDNYDSFTYNLSALIRSRLADPTALRVVRNDAAEADELLAAEAWTHVVLSPGPGHPRDAGLSLTVPPRAAHLPLLGVCLGHQVLAWLEGGDVTRTVHATHGSTVTVEHDGEGLFAGLDAPFDAALYHSLAVDPDTVPSSLSVSARSDRGTIMGVRHRTRPHEGVQFHPESFMTRVGERLIDTFLALGASPS